MKKIGILSLVIGLLVACSSKENEATISVLKTQIIAGHIENAANMSIELKSFDGQSMNSLMTAKTDENGNFKLNVNDSTLLVCQIIVNNYRVFPLVLTGNDSIYIKTTYPDLTHHLEISNSDYAEILNAYILQMDRFLILQDSIINRAGNIDKSDTASINKVRRTLFKEKNPIEQLVKNYIEKNPASPANVLLAQELYPVSGIEFWDTSFITTLKKVNEAYQSKYPNNKYTQSLAQQLISWEGSLLQYKKYKEKNNLYGGKTFKIAVGEIAPEIELKNPKGKTIKLSSLQGKYVLLDFWASWCSPCRRENPNVVKLYDKYKNKGFTVFSVSLDKKPDDWKKAIAQDHLVWENHVCDFDGWDSFAASLYHVTSIPFTLLLDKKGEIIAINLRGQQLEQKLISLLGN